MSDHTEQFSPMCQAAHRFSALSKTAKRKRIRRLITINPNITGIHGRDFRQKLNELFALRKATDTFAPGLSEKERFMQCTAEMLWEHVIIAEVAANNDVEEGDNDKDDEKNVDDDTFMVIGFFEKTEDVNKIGCFNVVPIDCLRLFFTGLFSPLKECIQWNYDQLKMIEYPGSIRCGSDNDGPLPPFRALNVDPRYISYAYIRQLQMKQKNDKTKKQRKQQQEEEDDDDDDDNEPNEKKKKSSTQRKVPLSLDESSQATKKRRHDSVDDEKEKEEEDDDKESSSEEEATDTNKMPKEKKKKKNKSAMSNDSVLDVVAHDKRWNEAFHRASDLLEGVRKGVSKYGPFEFKSYPLGKFTDAALPKKMAYEMRDLLSLMDNAAYREVPWETEFVMIALLYEGTITGSIRAGFNSTLRITPEVLNLGLVDMDSQRLQHLKEYLDTNSDASVAASDMSVRISTACNVVHVLAKQNPVFVEKTQMFSALARIAVTVVDLTEVEGHSGETQCLLTGETIAPDTPCWKVDLLVSPMLAKEKDQDTVVSVFVKKYCEEWPLVTMTMETPKKTSNQRTVSPTTTTKRPRTNNQDEDDRGDSTNKNKKKKKTQEETIELKEEEKKKKKKSQEETIELKEKKEKNKKKKSQEETIELKEEEKKEKNKKTTKRPREDPDELDTTSAKKPRVVDADDDDDDDDLSTPPPPIARITYFTYGHVDGPWHAIDRDQPLWKHLEQQGHTAEATEPYKKLLEITSAQEFSAWISTYGYNVAYAAMALVLQCFVQLDDSAKFDLDTAWNKHYNFNKKLRAKKKEEEEKKKKEQEQQREDQLEDFLLASFFDPAEEETTTPAVVDKMLIDDDGEIPLLHPLVWNSPLPTVILQLKRAALVFVKATQLPKGATTTLRDYIQSVKEQIENAADIPLELYSFYASLLNHIELPQQ